MRLPSTLLCLTMPAIASVHARWDDRSAGAPVLQTLDVGDLGTVESAPGHGATFFPRLPFRRASEGTEDATGPSRPDLMVGKRAVVVDDQNFNRFVHTDLLGRMSATTDQASSLDEARAAFRARTPDIVFVDFNFAGATGADSATWIRQEAPSGRDVPVVATTAFEVDEVHHKCEETGMDGFLAGARLSAQRLRTRFRGTRRRRDS